MLLVTWKNLEKTLAEIPEGIPKNISRIDYMFETVLGYSENISYFPIISPVIETVVETSKTSYVFLKIGKI